MLPDEIRNKSVRQFCSGMETTKPEHYQMFMLQMLQEGVAQLAVLNDTVRKLKDAVEDQL